MEKYMKKELILLTLVNLSSPIFAQTGPADGQFPVLKPRNACEVIVPSGKNRSQVYFSQDCQTAYILPSTKMAKTVLKPYLLVDNRICNEYSDTFEMLREMKPAMKELRTYIFELNKQLKDLSDENTMRITSEKIKYFSSQLEVLEKNKKDSLSRFSNIHAVRAQIRVETDIMSEVSAFQEANKGIVGTNGSVVPTRFVPAHITKSILAISPKDNEIEPEGRSTLKVSFPGIKYNPQENEKNEFDGDAHLVEMNGSMSGVVDLSATTYCSNVFNQKMSYLDQDQNLKTIFDSAVAINMAYQVPVQAGIRLFMNYHLSTKDFLASMRSNIVNTVYSRDEFFGQMIEGDVLNGLEIQVDDKGLEFDLSQILLGQGEEDAEKEVGTLGLLIGKFITEYMDAVESKLTKLNLLEKVPAEKAKEIAARTSSEIGGYQTTCKSKSNWFKSSKSCNTSPIYVTVNHAGISNFLKNVTDTSTISNKVIFESNQTTTVKHNSTFSMQ